MNPSFEIIFINHEGSEMSVFGSQVLSPLKALRERGFSVTLVEFEKWSVLFNSDKRAALRKKLEANRISSKLFPRLPFPFSVFIYLTFLQWVLQTKSKPVLLHARGPIPAFLSVLLKQLNPKALVHVIYDCRGDVVSETSVYAGMNIFAHLFRGPILRMIESYALKRIDHLLVVSTPLEKTIRRRYGYEGPASIVPSSVDPKAMGFSPDLIAHRQRQRSQQGWNDKIVLVYSGSALPWELPRMLIEMFKRFRTHDSRCFFLILTKDKPVFERLLKESKIPPENYSLMTCDYSELASRLTAADVALMLRERNAVNEAASPTKFAEYLACGVPVLLTEGIGDLDKIIGLARCGWILKNLNDMAEVDGLIKTIIADVRNHAIETERLTRTASEHFSIESRTDKTIFAYEKVARK